MLTVVIVLATNVSQTNLYASFCSELLSKSDSCLPLLLEWTTLMHQKKCTLKKNHSLSMGGTHSRVEANITSPTQEFIIRVCNSYMVSIPAIWIGWCRQSAVNMLSCENSAVKRRAFATVFTWLMYTST